MRAPILIAAGFALAFSACQPSSTDQAAVADTNAVEAQADTPAAVNEDNGKKVTQGSAVDRAQQRTEDRIEQLKNEVNTSSAYKYIESHPDYRILFKVLGTTHYAKRLHSESMTIFAPTNKAFEAMPQATMDALLKPENGAAREEFVARHLLDKAYPSEKVDALDDLLSEDGGRIHFGEDRQGPLLVNGIEMPRMHLQLGKSILISTDQILPKATGK